MPSNRRGTAFLRRSRSADQQPATTITSDEAPGHRARFWLRRVSILTVSFLLIVALVAGITALLQGDDGGEPASDAAVAIGSAEAIAYAADGDIWVFRVATDSVIKLTTGSAFDMQPRFISETDLGFIRDTGARYEQLHVTWTKGNDESLAFHTAYVLLGFDYATSRDKVTWLAYPSASGPVEPQLWHDGTNLLRRFAPRQPTILAGNSVLDWSRDGSLLLVELPVEDGAGEIFVLRADGADLIPPRRGSMARWVIGERSSMIYRDEEGWRQLDVATGAESRLPVPAEAKHVQISSDGKLAAFQVGSGLPGLRVVELATGHGILSLEKMAAPLWISNTELVATAVRPCTQADQCLASDPAWRPEGKVLRIDVRSRASREVPMGSTLDAEVLYSRSV